MTATITLTPENTESIAKIAALIGWTPDELANHLLAETLEEFANRNSGSLEGFLGAIYYPDRASAQRALDRVTQMNRAQTKHRSEIWNAKSDAVESFFEINCSSYALL